MNAVAIAIIIGLLVFLGLCFAELVRQGRTRDRTLQRMREDLAAVKEDSSATRGSVVKIAQATQLLVKQAVEDRGQGPPSRRGSELPPVLVPLAAVESPRLPSCQGHWLTHRVRRGEDKTACGKPIGHACTGTGGVSGDLHWTTVDGADDCPECASPTDGPTEVWHGRAPISSRTLVGLGAVPGTSGR